jgi:GNAT superfamily N-acetyltransferase
MRPATERDIAAVTKIVADAMMNDPLFVWAFPDALRRRGRIAQVSITFARLGITRGVVDLEPGAGVGIWYPPGSSPGPSTLLRGGILRPLMHSGTATIWRLLRADAQFDHAKRTAGVDRSSWYLAMLAVEPHAQGQGLGGRLLRRGTERADLTGSTIWRETSNPRNVELYERHGFEVAHHAAGGRHPEFWGMLRPPRPDVAGRRGAVA